MALHPGGGQLGGRIEQPGNDESQRQVAPALGGTAWQQRPCPGPIKRRRVNPSLTVRAVACPRNCRIPIRETKCQMQQISPSQSLHGLIGVGRCIKVVDIGANPIDGTSPYASLLQAGHANVVGFEPNPEALAKLNTIRGPNELYLPYAVADGERHMLRFCQAPGMNSLLEPNPAVLGLFHGFSDWGRVYATELIDTVRLDDIEATCGVELLKLDIQGAELMALRHGQDRLRKVLVVQTEVEFVPLYVDQPLFSEIDLFLRPFGFMLHRFYPAVSRVIRPMLISDNIYAGLSQLVWADAVFIRDITRLDLLTDDQLLRMATIMHDCYASLDVALHLLAEYDRRRGSFLGSAYLAGLHSSSTAEAPSPTEKP
jgi:FkbM family methyltransferase